MPQTRQHADPSMQREQEARRQVVSFNFYRILPEWRRLPLAEREHHRREAAEVLRRWGLPDELRVLTYSTVGTRSDSHFMLWRICYSLDCLQRMSADLLHTSLGGYVETTHAYLGMTKRSQYVISPDSQQHRAFRGGIVPGESQYLFVMPLVKTRDWYAQPWQERQRMIGEYVEVMEEFPRVRLHIMYSYGLSDQEYIIALETNHPEDVLDLSQRLRETENNSYIASDCPTFSCVQNSIEETLERLG
jgi:chlorite dismutase